MRAKSRSEAAEIEVEEAMPVWGIIRTAQEVLESRARPAVKASRKK